MSGCVSFPTWQRRLPTASGSDHRDRDKRLPGRTAGLPPERMHAGIFDRRTSRLRITGGGFALPPLFFTRDGQACQHPPRHITKTFETSALSRAAHAAKERADHGRNHTQFGAIGTTRGGCGHVGSI